MQQQKTRKEFEAGRQVGFCSMWTCWNVIEGYGLNQYGEETEHRDYCFNSRSEALKMFKESRWQNYKYAGHELNIDDFSFDCIGWYVEVQ